MINIMLQKKLALIIFLIFTLFFLFGMNSTLAQVRNTDITLQVFPEYPAPNQNVEARLRTFVVDLEKSYISWSVNGETLSGGIGRDRFTFNIGREGESTELSVSIETAGGESVVKTMRISSFEFDLLWEATDSYAPPFYRGKTLVGKEGNFKIVSLPSQSSGTAKISGNFSFAWQKENRAQQSQSGWGKNVYTFKNSYIDRDNNISVQVSDVEGKILSEDRIIITPLLPKIVFYRVDPVFGALYEESLKDGFRIKKEGEVVIAVPYFVHPKNLRSSDLVWDWQVGEAPIYTTPPQNILSVVPEKGSSGISTLRLNLDNKRNLFEGISKIIEVNF